MGLFGVSTDVWTAIAAIAAALQTVAIVFALLYAIAQTRQLNKQLQLSQISTLRDQFQRVNEILLNPEIRLEADEIGETKRNVFGSIILNTFGALYDLKRAGQMSEDEWKANYAVIVSVMKHERMWKYWLGDPDAGKPDDEQVSHRKFYPPDFTRLIDSTLPIADIPPKQLEKFPEIRMPFENRQTENNRKQ